MVLPARPLESETELPFAGLADLVRPIEHLLDRVARTPTHGADRGAGARPAGADRPVRGRGRHAQPARDGGRATPRSWRSSTTRTGWTRPSREALLFACRRLAGEGVVLLFAHPRPRLAPRRGDRARWSCTGSRRTTPKRCSLSTGVTIDAQRPASTGGRRRAATRSRCSRRFARLPRRGADRHGTARQPARRRRRARASRSRCTSDGLPSDTRARVAPSPPRARRARPRDHGCARRERA